MTVQRLVQALEGMPQDAQVLIAGSHRRSPISGLRETRLDELGREWPHEVADTESVVLILVRREP